MTTRREEPQASLTASYMRAAINTQGGNCKLSRNIRKVPQFDETDFRKQSHKCTLHGRASAIALSVQWRDADCTATASHVPLLHTVQTGSGLHSLLSNGKRSFLSVGLKWPVCEADHLPQISAEMKNSRYIPPHNHTP